jgi:hypothetical protein
VVITYIEGELMTGQGLYSRIANLFGIPSCLAVVFCLSSVPLLVNQAESQTLKGGVRDQEYVPGSGSGSSYPAPQMVPQTPTYQARPPAQHLNGGANTSGHAPLNGGANTSGHAPPILQGGVTQIALPPEFLGVWNVQGRRTKVEAQPEFQQGAEQAFSTSNQQIWTIQGGQGAYTLNSNTGIQTPFNVYKVQGSTAYIRYQHPVKNTMAQEAVVMSLVEGGAQFNGLERISIVKEGVSQPRAKVTYELVGTRQR